MRSRIGLSLLLPTRWRVRFQYVVEAESNHGEDQRRRGPVDRKRDVPDVAPRQQRRVLLGDLDGDVGPRVSRPHDEHVAVLQLAIRSARASQPSA